jgi:hypothetical protein
MRVHLRYLGDLLETVGPPAHRAPQSEPVANYV